jgi:hypothetical protein
VKRSIHGLVAALALSALLVLAAAPAAAVEFKGIGFHTSFQWGVGRGIVIVDRTAGAKPRLTAGFSGLRPGSTVSFVARDIGCDGAPSVANKVFKVSFNVSPAGGAAFTRSMSDAIPFSEVQSVWLDRGNVTNCSDVTHFQVAAGDVNGDNAVAATSTSSNPKLIMLLQSLPGDEFSIQIVINGMDGNDDYMVRAVRRACGRSAPDSSTVFGVLFNQGERSYNFGGQIGGDLNEIKSVRIRNTDSGKTWCAPVGIIAILIG